VRAAHRFYGYLGGDGGAVPYGAILLLLALGAVGFGLGAAIAAVFDLSLESTGLIGALLGIGGLVVWLLFVAAVAIATGFGRHADTDKLPRRALYLIDDLQEWRRRRR
jgi:hypothetical protein